MSALFERVRNDLILGVKTRNNNLVQQCCHQLNALLNSKPGDPILLFTVAAAYHQMGWNGTAITLYQSLISRNLEDEKIYNNLGSCYKAENMDDEAEAAWLNGVKISPSTELYNNLSTLYINKGNPAPGLVYAGKAIAIDPWNAQAHWNKGLLLLESGRWVEGIKEYEAGLSGGERGPKMMDGVPPWRGESLNGKTIIVTGEQGIGDEIMFMEALPELFRDARLLPKELIIECHDRLESLVTRNFPSATVLPTRKSLAKSEVIADYRTSLGSLFYRFRPTGEFSRQPYLRTDRDKVQKYKAHLAALGPPPYVGIGYEAGHKTTHGHVRSFKLSMLRPILDQKATFISLQYTKGAKEKFERFHKDTGIRIHHFPEAVESHLDDEYKIKSDGYDYDETVSLIAALDLCIVPCTSAVHVCGAIGKECWVLTPKQKAWRYYGDTHMRMYGDHVTMYHQNGGWDNVIKQLAIQLGRRIGKN